jgi:DNA repair exonuclease SbcCD nuclease subunit
MTDETTNRAVDAMFVNLGGERTVEDGDTGMTETMSAGQWDYIKRHAATLERLIEEGLDIGWLGEEFLQLVEEVNALSDLNSLLRGKLEGQSDEQ